MNSQPDFAALIDHTLLKPEATIADLEKHCQEARAFNFKTVCVRPDHLKAAVALLRGTKVLPITVVGFPTGKESTKAKVEETRVAKTNGAQEIDMVIAIHELKKKNYEYVFKDIQAVVKEAHPISVKVILETAELDQNEKVIGSALVKAAGAHFVKTSTGFGKAGATVEDIRLMRAIVGPDFGVKASGGIRDRKTATAMVEAGANRLGTSASCAIVDPKGEPQKADPKDKKSGKTPSNY
jgi:deoxyribose-phosphate aldolase